MTAKLYPRFVIEAMKNYLSHIGKYGRDFSGYCLFDNQQDLRTTKAMCLEYLRDHTTREITKTNANEILFKGGESLSFRIFKREKDLLGFHGFHIPWLLVRTDSPHVCMMGSCLRRFNEDIPITTFSEDHIKEFEKEGVNNFVFDMSLIAINQH